MNSDKKHGYGRWYVVAFLVVNIAAILLIGRKESSYVQDSFSSHAEQSSAKMEEVMDNYIHSFQLFSNMMAREIENNPNPDDIWDYLKGIDSTMLEIEGDTFDGLYMYYQGRYLYSWDTPYSQYEDTGYVATERPWYKDAVAGKGKVVFTPPYMSYANHYILSTISQLQPDGETVFAYDIKMGDIQDLVSTQAIYPDEQMFVFDDNGTILGSTNASYLGGILYNSLDETKDALDEARKNVKEAGDISAEDKDKLQQQADSLDTFYSFQKDFNEDFSRLQDQPEKPLTLNIGNTNYYGYLLKGDTYHFLVLVPIMSMLKSSLQIWLLPLLILELLLIYILGRVTKEQKNRELRAAYVQLGQTQKRLELALTAAQKAAAIDELTGLMNFHSFKQNISEYLASMEEDERCIMIMIDGDRFKAINDNYGHNVGDEVIKLCAQMIIGRIRTIDLASRLHGDEFAIFITKTGDYSVAKRIMEDINNTIAVEAKRRNLPAITMSAGAVIAKRSDNYTALSKIADDALYKAKEGHNGGFANA